MESLLNKAFNAGFNAAQEDNSLLAQTFDEWKDENMPDITIGSVVKLPLDEIGIVRKIITNTIDFFPYKIEIIKGTFNPIGHIFEFKKQQIEIIP